jgi:outer membrane protein with beta-barrel domain
MKVLFLFAASLFLINSANTQIHYGIKAGVAMNDVSSSFSSNEKSLFGFQSSLFATYHLNRSIISQPSLGYYRKGNKLTDITFVDQYGNLNGFGDLTVQLDYLELVVPFQFLIVNKKWKFYGGLGPFVSYAVGGTYKYKYDPGPYANEPTTKPIVFGSDGTNRLDAGAEFLFSALFGKRYIISINFDQGLTYLDPYSDRKTMSAGITFGYLFK